MRRLLMVGLWLIAGCASAKQGTCVGACDGGGGSNDLATPSLDASMGADFAMAAKKMFGDPCTDSSQCMSKICVFSGKGGTCTQECPSIGCPAGYGCYGVLGAVDPGIVSDVCVPESNLLCTPCSAASQCGSPLGSDLCLPYPTGNFCGRDCSAIACPPTYTCAPVPSLTDGGTVKQCVPNNNSCDCTPANAGHTAVCTITTPLGTACSGTETCNGAQGWSACKPPSASDDPDDPPTFVDSNCDGIDGDVSKAIFVDALAGNDNFAGTMAKPVASVGKAIAIALAASKNQIYVSKGTYAPLALTSGMKIYGGYDAANNWQRSTSNTTTIGDGVATTAVSGSGLVGETRLELFHLVSGPATIAGGSSYGVRITGSSGPVLLRNDTITAGDGFKGGDGAPGSRGPGSDFNTAGINYDGSAGANACNGSCGGGCGTRGTGGGSFCGRTGGNGGDGSCGNNTGGSGAKGNGPGSAGGTLGTGGSGCSIGAPCLSNCTHSVNPVSGGAGSDGANGSGGGGALQLGGVTASGYRPGDGSDGTAGVDGAGGGGGGAGAGSGSKDIFCDTDQGAGGGAGGGAGCAGSNGTRGAGGGGSFGVFVIGSVVTVDKNTITTGAGGGGGLGGDGKSGGAGGGLGGPGSANDDGQGGAPGGSGGHGGGGGGGSGGAGGPAVGLFTHAATLSVPTGNSYANIGTGGAGGAGGANGGSNPATSASPGPTGLSATTHSE